MEENPPIGFPLFSSLSEADLRDRNALRIERISESQKERHRKLPARRQKMEAAKISARACYGMTHSDPKLDEFQAAVLMALLSYRASVAGNPGEETRKALEDLCRRVKKAGYQSPTGEQLAESLSAFVEEQVNLEAEWFADRAADLFLKAAGNGRLTWKGQDIDACKKKILDALRYLHRTNFDIHVLDPAGKEFLLPACRFIELTEVVEVATGRRFVGKVRISRWLEYLLKERYTIVAPNTFFDGRRLGGPLFSHLFLTAGSLYPTLAKNRAMKISLPISEISKGYDEANKTERRAIRRHLEKAVEAYNQDKNRLSTIEIAGDFKSMAFSYHEPEEKEAAPPSEEKNPGEASLPKWTDEKA